MQNKSDIRLAVYHDLGCSADDWLESALAQKHAHEGAKKALLLMGKNLGLILSRVEEDLAVGVVSSDAADYANLCVKRCIDAVLSAARHAENCALAANGAVVAHQHTVRYLKKLVDVEERSESSVHPGESLASKRKREGIEDA